MPEQVNQQLTEQEQTNEIITISAAFSQTECELGMLGRTGEHGSRQIVFDCSEVLTDDTPPTIICVCLRPGDETPYAVELTEDGTSRCLLLSSTELAYAGRITFELRAVENGRILKSAFFRGLVEESLQGTADTPGAPLTDAMNG